MQRPDGDAASVPECPACRPVDDHPQAALQCTRDEGCILKEALAAAPVAASDQRDDFEEKPDPVSTNPFYPSSSLVVKLGSALVHAEEMSEPGAHPFDLDAFRRLASDPEVVAWREALGAMALLPIKRSAS